MESRRAEPSTQSRHDNISIPPAPGTHQQFQPREEVHQQHPPSNLANVQRTISTRAIQLPYSSYSPSPGQPRRPTERVSYTMLHRADQTRHGQRQLRLNQRKAIARQQRKAHMLNQLTDLLESTPALEIELSMIHAHGIEAYEKNGLGMGLAWVVARFQWEVEHMDEDEPGLWFAAEDKVERIEEDARFLRVLHDFSFRDWWDWFVSEHSRMWP